MVKTIWFDFTNPPHTNMLLPILNYYRNKNYNVFLTARDFAETINLLKLKGLQFQVIGRHAGKNKIKKVLQLVSRDLKLMKKLKKFDVSISCSNEAPQVSWLRRKISIVFDDNDISPNWLYSKFATYVFSPSVIDKDKMLKLGIGGKKLITYDGFKEDVYIADYRPDPLFLQNMPFENFITIRPENIFGAYVNPKTRSIVPALIKELTQLGFNILFLPRYEEDKKYCESSKNVYIPSMPFLGLDVCYYSQAVLTGAGTFAREAALMGTPAVSFFPGNILLSVDKKLIEMNKIFYSRDIYEIVDFVSRSKKNTTDMQRSKLVQKEVFKKLDGILEFQ